MHRDKIPGLPEALFHDCVLNIGRRGSGKSVMFRVAMERALTKGIRCGWIDAMGIGWGITVRGKNSNREKPDGPGYEVVVFGGEHGKIPLTENMGAALGRQLAKATFSWVLDLKSLKNKASRVRFLAAFTEELYENCREHLLLFVDEVDLWAPQMILDKRGPAAELLSTMEEIVRRGRVKGLAMWMATQRPAVCAIGLRSQVEALITFRLILPHDIEAAMDWIRKHLGKDRAAKIERELPSMSKGEAIVYLTEPMPEVSKVQFPMCETLDTFKPPSKGQKGPSDKNMAEVDLEAVRKELGSLQSEIDANDPAELRRRIAELEREKSGRKLIPSLAPIVDDKRVFERGYNQGFPDGFNAAFKETIERVRATLAPLDKKLSEIVIKPHWLRNAIPADDGVALLSTAHPRKNGKAPPHRDIPRNVLNTIEVEINNDVLNGPEARIVTAMGQWNAMGFEKPTREQVAALSNYHVRTGSFLNALSSLRSKEWIDYGDGTLFFVNGHAPMMPALGPHDVHNLLRKNLDGPQTKIFEALLSGGQGRVMRGDLAAVSGYHERTGSFLNALSALRTRAIIDYEKGGTVFLRPWVFGEH